MAIPVCQSIALDLGKTSNPVPSSSTAGMLLSLSPFLLGEIHTFADESPSSLADSLDSHPFFFGKSNYSYLIHNSLNHIQLMYFLCLIIFQSAYFRGFFQQRECRNQLFGWFQGLVEHLHGTQSWSWKKVVPGAGHRVQLGSSMTTGTGWCKRGYPPHLK